MAQTEASGTIQVYQPTSAFWQTVARGAAEARDWAPWRRAAFPPAMQREANIKADAEDGSGTSTPSTEC